jgi:hypothetical protein
MDEPRGVSEADEHLVDPIDEPRARPGRPAEPAAAKHLAAVAGDIRWWTSAYIPPWPAMAGYVAFRGAGTSSSKKFCVRISGRA